MDGRPSMTKSKLGQHRLGLHLFAAGSQLSQSFDGRYGQQGRAAETDQPGHLVPVKSSATASAACAETTAP